MHMNNQVKQMGKNPALCIKDLINENFVIHFTVAITPEVADDHPGLDSWDQLSGQIFYRAWQRNSELT